jgi:thiol-disulfide isomerase/thioredoxin
MLLSKISIGQQTVSLKLGDKAPQLSTFKWIKGTQVKKWEQDKIYVIDFAATWCTPCAAAIPVLSSIQDKYKDIIVVSNFVMEQNDEPLNTTNPTYVKNVENYVKRQGNQIRYAVAVDDPEGGLQKQWLKAAALNGIPQIFIVDGEGIINWIGTDAAQASKIVDSIKAKTYNLTAAVKKAKMALATPYDHEKLLLIDGNGGDDTDFLFRSVLTRFNGKIQIGRATHVSSFRYNKPDSVFENRRDMFQIIGSPLINLYYIAYSDTLDNQVDCRNFYQVFNDTIKEPFRRKSYGKYWYEPILEVTNKKPFEFSWRSPYHRYNYSLKVPKGAGSAEFLQQAVRRDLETYFGYDVVVETRLMLYWKLYTPNKSFAISKLKSKDQLLPFKLISPGVGYLINNAEMRDMLWMLGSTYGYGTFDYKKLPKSEQSAFIDETGITDKIDFFWDKNSSFDQMRESLKAYGLELVKAYKPMKVIIIRDSKL